MTLQEQLQGFISQYTGKTGVGDTDQNKGQCVGLIEVWFDALGLPHDWGNAKDLLANADPNSFTVIYNNPNDTNQFPVAGDVIVWGATWGNGYGHTGIVVTANGASFTTFEQNDITSNDQNGACEVLTHDYTGVLGWLHPKQQTTQATTSQSNMYKGYDLTNQDSMKVAVDLFVRVQNGEFVEKTKYDTDTQKLQEAVSSDYSLYQQQLQKNTELSTQLTQVQQEEGDYKQKYETEQAENVRLNTALETMARGNKDYSTETMDAQGAMSDLRDYLYAIADSLKVARSGITDKDLAENILAAINNQKATILEQKKTQEKTANQAWMFIQQFFTNLAKKKI